MNEAQIFKNLKDIQFDETFGREKSIGVIYAVEYGDLVKIGCTRNPKIRLFALKSQCEKYSNKRFGRVLISEFHCGYSGTEHELHAAFSPKRITDTELFTVTLEEVQKAIKQMPDLKGKQAAVKKPTPEKNKNTDHDEVRHSSMTEKQREQARRIAETIKDASEYQKRLITAFAEGLIHGIEITKQANETINSILAEKDEPDNE